MLLEQPLALRARMAVLAQPSADPSLVEAHRTQLLVQGTADGLIAYALASAKAGNLVEAEQARLVAMQHANLPAGSCARIAPSLGLCPPWAAAQPTSGMGQDLADLIGSAPPDPLSDPNDTDGPGWLARAQAARAAPHLVAALVAARRSIALGCRDGYAVAAAVCDELRLSKSSAAYRRAIAP